MVEQTEPTTAVDRWAEIRIAAGYETDQALLRAAEMTAGQIWSWINPKDHRDPNITSLRTLKRLLGVSLDVLDELIMAMRYEKRQAAAK